MISALRCRSAICWQAVAVLRLIVGRPAHFPALRRVAQAHDLPSAAVLVTHAHRVVRGAPWNNIGRHRGKHDSLAVDDFFSPLESRRE